VSKLNWKLAVSIFHAWTAFVGCDVTISIAEASDDETAGFYRAIEICKAMTKRPMALDLDRRVLCLDGNTFPDEDISLANRLQEEGVFVVRSTGVEPDTAIKLAKVLQAKRAKVVIYDFCLSTCASYLLFASTSAFVRRRTLVAWLHPSGEHKCSYWEEARDGGPRRLEVKPCVGAPRVYRGSYEQYTRSRDEFYAERAINPPFDDPPQSAAVRSTLWSQFGAGENFPPYLLWTWHPRYYVGEIRTRVTYEAYPTQEEVDVLAEWLKIVVIRDP